MCTLESSGPRPGDEWPRIREPLGAGYVARKVAPQADRVFEPTGGVTRCYEDVPPRAVLVDPFGAAPGFSAPRTSPCGTAADAFSA